MSDDKSKAEKAQPKRSITTTDLNRRAKRTRDPKFLSTTDLHEQRAAEEEESDE